MNKFEEASCWKIFPRHGELAREYLDKFCGGGGSCYGQREEDPWWQKLNKKQKSMPDLPVIPVVPGPAPVPLPVPIP